jgi:hypothetical protein
MADEKQMRMAVARLRGLRSHLYPPITRSIVDEYHSILKSLEDASGEPLQYFSISPVAMLARELSETRRRPTTLRFEAQFTSNQYCDTELFQTKLDGLLARVEKMAAAARTPES